MPVNCMFLSKLSQPGSMRSNVPHAPRTPPTFDILQPPAGPHPILILGRAAPTDAFSQSDHAYAHTPHACSSDTCCHHDRSRRYFGALTPTSRQVQDAKIRKLFGVILARVRKREVNTNVPTIHPSPLVTSNIIIPFTCATRHFVHLPLERWIMEDIWIYPGDMYCSKLVSKP